MRLGGSTTSDHGVHETGNEIDGLDGQPIERYKRWYGIHLKAGLLFIETGQEEERRIMNGRTIGLVAWGTRFAA